MSKFITERRHHNLFELKMQDETFTSNQRQDDIERSRLWRFFLKKTFNICITSSWLVIQNPQLGYNNTKPIHLGKNKRLACLHYEPFVYFWHLHHFWQIYNPISSLWSQTKMFYYKIDHKKFIECEIQILTTT